MYFTAKDNRKENTIQTPSQCLIENLGHLEKYVNTDVPQQLQELCISLKLSGEYAATIDIENTTNCYIVRLLHVLHTLNNNINFHSDAKEDLISVAHLKLCIRATQELSYYALRSNLHHDFYKSPVFKKAQCNGNPSSQSQLLLSIQFFISFLPIRQLHIANSMELVQRDLLAAIITLRIQQLPLEQFAQLDAAIRYLWDNESKADFFRHVLLLKATPNLCVPLSKELHQQLLSKLSSAHGFASLVAALQAAAQDLDTTRSSEIVANIVAQRGFSPRLQQLLISQIFDFCRLQLPDLNSLICGVLSLRRLYELNESNRQCIQRVLASNWQPLTEPTDLINGLIIFEQSELSEHIRLWQQLFCSSSVACLPSTVLVPYLPVLLQIYQSLPDTLPEQQSLAALISRCLDNREPLEELPELLRRLFSWQVHVSSSWKSLHQRVLIEVNANLITAKVTNAEGKDQERAPCRALSSLLMSGNNHALTCKMFLSLLRLMVQQLSEPTVVQSTATDLLSTESELADFLHGKYQLKLELLMALDQLVWHEPLKAQLAETNSKQFIQLVTELLEQRLAGNLEAVDQTLVVILMLLLEILERSELLQLAETTRRLEQPLQQLASLSANQLVKNATIPLLSLLNGKEPHVQETGRSFQTARDLIEQRQPHLQVYGIQMMLEALRKKDPAFTSQCHRILALALSTLKSKESYTFLNCVRLFVQLVHIMESEVLDLLGDEYLSETAELDYRLVVGEAILKAAQEIGPLCYRYKGVLFNCFLHGAQSPLEEFRTSAFANLAQLCRLLAYQVHSFFQELLQLVDAELSSGRYLPAKRGALLVLSELLAGMESLFDYQEMLLPIYRLLRAIEAAESCDPQMRQHAANGLKTLNEKCRQLLNTESVEKLQHEIKVLGIKEPVATKKKHILELN